jgi:hypothetical protein
VVRLSGNESVLTEEGARSSLPTVGRKTSGSPLRLQ